MLPGCLLFIPGRHRVTASALVVGVTWLTVCTALMGAAPGQGGSSEFLVSSWHTEDGLPDGNVTAIAQTPEGYWWVGTFKGLARFDGVRFTVMEVQRGNSLPDARVAALHVGRAGKLWVGFASGHLAWMEDGHCHPVDFTSLPTNAPALLAPEWSQGIGHSTHSRLLRSASLVEDGAGALWFHAGGDVLLRVKDGKASLLTTANGLPGGSLRSLVCDSAGAIWLLTSRGLYQRQAEGWVQRVEFTSGPSDETVCAPSAGRALVLSLGRTVQRWRSGQLASRLDVIPDAPGSQRTQVTALLDAPGSRLWVGTHWSGVLYADDTGHWRRPRQEGPLAQCRVLALFADRLGTVWVGTLGDGLHRLTPCAASTVHLPAPAEGHLVNTVCAARDGSVWAGTDGAGAFRAAGDAVEAFGTNAGLPGLVYSVMEDGQSNLWFGTSAGLFQRSAGRFERVAGFPPQSGGVLAQFQDREGALWFASSGGPVRWAEGKFELQRLRDRPGAVEIRSFAQDREGGLWVGTIGQGLFCLRSNRVEHHGPAQGLTHPDARSLCVDAEGRLWVGTLGGGLFRQGEGRFEAITTTDGLPDDTINGILADKTGNLWMSSYNGFFGCSRQLLAAYKHGVSSPLVFRRLSPAEGLDYRACSGAGQPVVSRAPDGRIWFANQRSLAVFDPQVVLRWPSTPTVLVESLVADGLAQPLSLAQTASVPSATRRYEFHYTALNLARPEQARFRHRLRGVEEDWADAGAARVAAYGHLEPREYEFEVTAAGPDGVWQSAASIKLEVVPSFTERPLVRVGAGALLVTTAVVVAYAASHARMRRRLLLLEMKQATERERRRIAHDLHDDLGGSLTEISLLAGSVPATAEGSEVLGQVQRKADGLVHALDEIVWAVNPRHDSAASLAEYLAGYARDFLEAAGLRLRLELPRDLPAVTLTPEQRHGLFLAAKEALNNVIRHAHAREVHLRLAVESRQIRIVLQDNGCGFDSAQTTSAGNGLTNLHERLKQLGGQATIRSEPGTGTTVELSLPLS